MKDSRFAGLARAGARRVPAQLLADSLERFGPVDGTFVLDSGEPLPLYARYRDGIKPWRLYWWPVRVLSELAARVELPPDAAGLLHEVARSRALPLSPRDLALAVGALVERYPDELVVTGTDDGLDAPRVELMPREVDVVDLVRRYRASALQFRDTVRAHGLELEGARLLDVGTGSGRLAFALAGLGADEVVGVDLSPEGGVPSLQRDPVRERLTDGGRVRLERADASRLEAFEDGSFDLVCSMSAIEHFEDLPAVLTELARVLRPGGLMYHGVDPWFGKGGGHSLCTLDVPWGHVRLTPAEFERYVTELRPHERADAMGMYQSGFQVPRRTLVESRAAFEAAGLDVLEWREVPLPLRDPHRRLATGAFVRDCRRRSPTITRRDLLALSYGVVARRR